MTEEHASLNRELGTILRRLILIMGIHVWEVVVVVMMFLDSSPLGKGMPDALSGPA